MTFEGVILNELEGDSNEDDDEERKEGSQQEESEARTRTYTFASENLGLPKVNETAASAEVSPAKCSPQYKEMQDRKDQLKADLIKVQSPVQKEPRDDDDE